MATNPNNSFGTNAAYGGRTSPNAFNDVLGSFSGRGILSGWACAPNTGMSVVLGGDGTTRDVAIAEDNAGNKTTVDNIPGSPISISIAAAPASQSRIDAIVVYITNPPQGASTATDNYGTVGVLDVQGATASTPVAPDENAIRTAITADGASGATAYYVVLAYISVATGTTTITSNMITAGPLAKMRGTAVSEAYPVGSIYLSVNNTNPSNLFGGVWQQIKDTFLLAAGDNYAAGTTGGEATHTLTTNEMPSHNHYGLSKYDNDYITNFPVSSTGSFPQALCASPTDTSHKLTTANAGGGQAHNNMPPYLTVYMWQRTA